MTSPKSQSGYKAEWGLDPGFLTLQGRTFSTRFIIKVIINISEKTEWWDIAGVMLSFFTFFKAFFLTWIIF